jgi:heme/copper-type cytochrome/quinol oxidase subunit 3
MSTVIHAGTSPVYARHPPGDLAIWIFILVAVAWKAWGGAYSAVQHTGIETGASYWHMVDLVWLILFPLVYVMH